MIRPCDQCGGRGETYAVMPTASGGYTITEGHDPRPCPRCAVMPWLPAIPDPEDPNLSIPADGNGFRPDPESVMRWCFAHHSRYKSDDSNNRPRCENVYLVMWRSQREYKAATPCDIGWVERPTRLEVAE